MEYKSEIINEQPDELKIEYLEREIFKGKYVLGRVGRRLESKVGKNEFTFVTLVETANVNNHYLLDGKPWAIYCKIDNLKESVRMNLKKGDLICFRFELAVVKSSNSIIQVDSKSVKIFNDYNRILKAFDVNFNNQEIEYHINETTPEELEILLMEEYKRKIENINAELVEQAEWRKKEIGELEAQKEEAKKWIENQKNSLKEEENKLKIEADRLKEEKQELERLKAKLAYFGLSEFQEPQVIKEDKFPYFKGGYTQLYDYVRNYVRNNEKLAYNDAIIRRFLLALQCKELVVLTGPSGTGKTSIVRAFAKAFNGVAKIIAVKPNWTDSEDLLGFYNPIEKAYVATPFLDALVEAKKKENADKIYLICLDEMNLAHIEYYFAEFLSKMEERSETPSIELYSQEIYDDLIKEIGETISLMEAQDMCLELPEIKKWCEDNDKQYPGEVQKLKTKIKLIEKYPAKFTIPENVRFIGTLNVDQTTKSISPKVIDRSFIIEILQDKEARVEPRQEVEQQYVTINEFTKSEINKNKIIEFEDTLEDSNANAIISEINLANKHFEVMNASLNHRGMQHIKQYIKNSQGYRDVFDLEQFSKNTILEDIIYMKMIPRLSTSIRSKEDKTAMAWEAFIDTVKTRPLNEVNSKIEKMNEAMEQDNILSFWGVY